MFLISNFLFNTFRLQQLHKCILRDIFFQTSILIHIILLINIGLGNEKEGHVYRGVSYSTSDIQRRYLSIVVNDDFEEVTIKAIIDAGSTGEVGDGKIFVSQVDEVYRIRTGEKGGNTLK